MRIQDLREKLARCPLVASVQADATSPLHEPSIILRLAEASLGEGVEVLRLQGILDILAVKAAHPNVPIAGLIKTEIARDQVYISPSLKEVQALIEVGCEIVCVDGTSRPRPGDATLEQLIQMIHGAGRLALADCDHMESARFASLCGADIISTTLSGYTEHTPAQKGPDLNFVRQAARELSQVVLAEGRYSEAWQIESAIRAGAAGVVVGGALNDPIKQTRALRPPAKVIGRIGAVDMGGTWLRFAVFDEDWKMRFHERIELPETHFERVQWIKDHAKAQGVTALGIGTGGTVDPVTGQVIESKDIIPDHQGQFLNTEAFGLPTLALNDGLATAWGHAQLPEYAGKRVATLALGTGVGCGLVDRNALWMGPGGRYPRINDLKLAEGHTLEDYLGGAAIRRGSTKDEWAVGAAKIAIEAIETLYYPDAIVLSGGVGLSPLMRPLLSERVIATPFSEDAGIFGAAALALYPPSLP